MRNKIIFCEKLKNTESVDFYLIFELTFEALFIDQNIR